MPVPNPCSLNWGQIIIMGWPILLSAFKQTVILHSFLSERKWGYYVQMHDNKEREWREHSFLTPTLLHHTPIATLCHPTPSFLPVLFLVYWIFLFFFQTRKQILPFCAPSIVFDDSDTHKQADMWTFLIWHCPSLHLTEAADMCL